MLAAPILIAAFFGAVLGDPQRKPARVPIAVADLDGSAVSARIVEAMRPTRRLRSKLGLVRGDRSFVRNGKVRAVAVIPRRFRRGGRPRGCCCSAPSLRGRHSLRPVGGNRGVA
ncbi:MAG: hypothetical protein IPI27_09650 [Betaproteobacteria bacterium]|nr:hypothetical protein [Betaproteobacteria bacterium]